MSHVVVYVPGIGDQLPTHWVSQSTALWFWRPLYGIHAIYFESRWTDTSESFAAKKQRLLATIDQYVQAGHTVSLIGPSAGATLMLVAFNERPKLNAAISVCGKLRNPAIVGQVVYDVNPAFKEALEQAMAVEPRLNAEQRSRILLVRPAHDNFVPVEDNWVGEATITRLPTSGHIVSILASITIFARRIVRFIRANHAS